MAYRVSQRSSLHINFHLDRFYGIPGEKGGVRVFALPCLLSYAERELSGEDALLAPYSSILRSFGQIRGIRVFKNSAANLKFTLQAA